MNFWFHFQSFSADFVLILTSFLAGSLCKIASIPDRSSGSDFGCPRARFKVKKLDFHSSVVQNRGSTFSRQGPSGNGFSFENGAEMDVQINKKVIQNALQKSIRN